MAKSSTKKPSKNKNIPKKKPSKLIKKPAKKPSKFPITFVTGNAKKL